MLSGFNAALFSRTSRLNVFLHDLPRLWFRADFVPSLFPFLPFSWLFGGMAWIRRFLYHCWLLPSFTLRVPVIVVGNLTVGGSGKTPLALWLVDRLREAGWHPGIVSRGYGASKDGVYAVLPDSPVTLVGDEPLLLARRSGVPVFVGRNRVAACNAMLNAYPDCNVIVSDDGLQHYRLHRLVEIAVFDARGIGNGHLLPAGPLREPVKRLSEATAIVWNSCPSTPGFAAGLPNLPPAFSMCLKGQDFYRLGDAGVRCSVDDLRGKQLHAVAGTGNPSRFFTQIEALGLEFEPHPFPDHHIFSPEDFDFAQRGIVLMTEKDAVKCAGILTSEAWVFPVNAQLEPAANGQSLSDIVLEKLNGPATA